MGIIFVGMYKNMYYVFKDVEVVGNIEVVV